MNSTLLQDFLEELRLEKRGYDRLLEIAVQKKEIIMRGSPEEMLLLVEQEEAVSADLSQVSEKRRALSDELARELGLPDDGTLALRDVEQRLPAQQAAYVSRIRTQFSDVLAELKKVNDINKLLLDTQLEYIGSTLSSLTRTASTDYTYNKTGNWSDDARTRAIFDAKV